MSAISNQLNHISVAYPSYLEHAREEAIKITKYLSEAGLKVASGALKDDKIIKLVENRATDLLIVLGGDGTVLRAGHLCAPSNIPILAINMGHFGFLIEVTQENWPEKLPELLNNNYWLENRMMLQVQHTRGADVLGTWEVLNEAMIGRGEIARPVHLETELDGRRLTTYVADGLLVATPTGSTAYALAAGGPILPPELRNILVIPVAPHLSLDRAIVVAEGSAIGVTVRSDHQSVLSIDGKNSIKLKRNDCIKVRASENTVSFVRFEDRGYFFHHLIQLMDQNPSTGARK